MMSSPVLWGTSPHLARGLNGRLSMGGSLKTQERLTRVKRRYILASKRNKSSAHQRGTVIAEGIDHPGSTASLEEGCK